MEPVIYESLKTYLLKSRKIARSRAMNAEFGGLNVKNFYLTTQSQKSKVRAMTAKKYIERRKGWLETLRTTTIPQTTGVLNRTISGEGASAGMCCLGVGTEYAIAHGCQIEKTPIGDHIRYDSEYNTMPDAAIRWFGFESNAVIKDVDDYKAWQLNDVFNLSFSEIADLLEKSIL